jgi:hypothetical protein
MEEKMMKTMLASAAVAATVLGTAVPASAQWYGDPYVRRPYYGPAYSGYYWGGPRVYVAPPAYGVAPAYRYGVAPAYPYGYGYAPAWGGPRWGGWD